MSGLEQPKKPAGGGFGRFVAEKRSEFQAKCAGQPVSAVSKMAGLAWKALSEAAQQPYKTKFLEAQKKYEVDMVAFLAAGGEKQKGAAALRTEKRKAKEGTLKKQKDPNAPKRPAGGAYGCFIAANRAEFTKQCPGSITGVAKLAGEKWKAVSVAEKEKYEKDCTTNGGNQVTLGKKARAHIFQQSKRKGTQTGENSKREGAHALVIPRL